jgi:hypothetical protein
MADLEGTPEQQFIFLNLHWGRMYVFTASAVGSTTWTAQARFGEHDELQAESGGELLYPYAITTRLRNSLLGSVGKHQRQFDRLGADLEKALEDFRAVADKRLGNGK